MSTISAGTTSGTALVTSGDTTGQLVFQTNGTTTALTLNTNQTATFAGAISAPSISLSGGALPVSSGGTGSTSLTANNVLLGNGTSAFQVVAPGTAGNVLMSNGTTWTSAAASSGALTLLQTVTASNSSTVDLQTGIGSTYDFYLITFTNITSTSQSLLNARMRIGGSYATSNYHAMANCGYSNGTGNLAINQSSSSAIQLILTSLPTDSGSTVSGELWFSNPTSTLRQKTLNWVTAGIDMQSVYAFTTQGTAAHNDALVGALSGIRFYFASGTIGTGVFRLYGLANS